MQIKATTDYALRCVLYLAIHPGSSNAEEIGRQTGITINYTRRILQDLKKIGIVRSLQGVTGGYVLVKDPRDITILSIIEAEEQDIFLNRFMEEGAPVFWISEKEKSSMRLYMDTLQILVKNYLHDKTVYDVLHPGEEKTGQIERIV